MRNDLIESLCIGGAIGIAILVMHLFTTGAAPLVQLLALLAAAIVVAAAQLLLSSWRHRQGAAPRSQPGEYAPTISQLRRRRNPFFRELTRDWTGLDEYSAEEAEQPAGLGGSRTQQNTEPTSKPRRP